MNVRRRTKIVATLGPATNQLDRIKELILAGVNVFRLNFSHGSHEEHLENIQKIRAAEEELNVPVAVLQDLSGPKIRITELDDGAKPIVRDEEILLKHGSKTSDHQTLYSPLLDPTKILKPGHTILLADGVMVLEVLDVTPDAANCKIIRGGSLRSRIGIAFPDSVVDLPATTEKDMKDLSWGLENKVDFVAVSFVQKAADIEKVTDKLKDYSNVERPLVIAKIEMRKAIDNISEILSASDGIMVARGDLGVEFPVEQVPTMQKDIIARANAMGKPVIVATQMLHSMVHANRPTRAEVTDVATAVNSGTDAVMLSEETAIGQYPVESVEYLAKIATEAEKEFNFDIYKRRFELYQSLSPVTDAIAYAACAAAHHLKASAIAACTETGLSARLVAKYRPRQALYGVSTQKLSMRRMCLYWGVVPILLENPDSRGTEIDSALREIKELENLPEDAIGIVTGGLTVRVPGTTSVLEIRTFELD